MDIYLIKRAEEDVGYDEIAGMVIISKTREAAIDYFLREVNEALGYESFLRVTEDDISVDLVGKTLVEYKFASTYEVLTDFRAG